jgi:hypothetical protein
MDDRLRAAGFDAVWVQMNGYEDGGTALYGALTGLLGSPAVVKQNGVVAVWRLRPGDATARSEAAFPAPQTAARE